METKEIKKAHKRKDVLVDVRVEADLTGMLWRHYYKEEEERAKELERAVKDFHDFLRDHRSQDMVTLSVERIRQDLCSACGYQWEAEKQDDGITICLQCGAEIEEPIDD